MDGNSIMRVVKQGNFSVMANRGLRDRTLSYKARGLLALCLTMPNDWHFNLTWLIDQSDQDGRDSVQAGLKELEAAGYLYRKEIRDQQGRLRYAWLVFEFPYQELGYSEEALEAMVQDVTPQNLDRYGFTAAVNPHLLNTDNTNTYPQEGIGGNPPAPPERTKPAPRPKTKPAAQAHYDQPDLPLPAPDHDAIRDRDFNSYLDQVLQEALTKEARSVGRYGPRSFQTMAQKVAYREAATGIVNRAGWAELDRAITYSLERGRSSREDVIAALGRWLHYLENPPARKPAGANGNGNGHGGRSKVMSTEEYRAVYAAEYAAMKAGVPENAN